MAMNQLGEITRPYPLQGMDTDGLWSELSVAEFEAISQRSFKFNLNSY